MRLAFPALLLLALLASTPTDAATKPCGWYFTDGRGVPENAPVSWLSGVWTGSAGTSAVELVWMPMTAGTMAGVARAYPVSQHAPERTLWTEYYQIRRDANGKLVYLEQAGSAAPVAFDLIEGRDGVAVFEHKDGKDVTRVSLRRHADGAGKLVLTRTAPGGVTTSWQAWREI